MALFISGMECSLCCQPITNENELIAFGPFVANRRDPLYVFSDAVFHRACFERHSLSEKAIQRHKDVVQHGGYERLRCVVCNEIITDPDEYFYVGFLTDDPTNPLFEFNYIQFHVSHFLSWNRAADFQRLVTEFFSSDGWKGPQLKFDPLPSWIIPPELTVG